MKNCRSENSTGAALVLVLTFLLLVSALVLAFLSSVTTELSGAKSYAGGVTAKQLADSATQLVTATIGEATSRGNSFAWASQPGMIRLYDNAGAPDSIYKLYSSNCMIIGSTLLPAFRMEDDLKFAPSDAATDWKNKSAVFTDLNSPMVGDQGPVFPIIDGNSIKLLQKTASGATVPDYLGYDADKDGLPDIDGFAADPSRIAYSGSDPVSPSNNPVPLPVRWIYVLRDGALTSPTGVGADGKTATWTGSSRPPSQDNPIVGRIAFWTDDESCKVNINTASEGCYMDIPRTYTQVDAKLATRQPAQHEFQRYPGHPAMTSLSPIFRFTDPEQIYSIIPRIVGGGSRAGTVAATGTLSTDKDRLYASVDELAFSLATSGGRRQPNDTTRLTQDTLDRARFFLTANGRSPDLNLFGTPRVCLWPLHVTDDSDHRTSFDRLIAFCSTVNRRVFHFVRENPASATNDLPAIASTSGLGRNRMLLEYLRHLTSRAIPGFGGSFGAKYSAVDTSGKLPNSTTEIDQILIQMFDYIRCANLLEAAKQTNPNFVQFAPKIPPNTGDSVNSGQGQVVPIEDTKTGARGFGRFPTIAKASLHLIGTADNSTNSTVPAGMLRVQAGFFLELFDPSLGFVGGYPKLKVRVSGLENFRWGTTTLFSMGFPGPDTVVRRPVSFSYGLENYIGGTYGFSFLAYKKGTSGSNAYPLISATRDFSSAAGTLINFAGGDVKVELLSDDGNDTVLQKVTVNFPDAANGQGFPMPALAPATVPTGPSDIAVNFRSFVAGGNGGRLNSTGTGPNGSYSPMAWIIDADVVRSVQVTSGDIRLIAARKEVTNNPDFFSPHPRYSVSSAKMAHSLRTGQGVPYFGATGGKLANIGYTGYTTSSTNGRAASYTMSPAWDFGNPSTTGVALGKATPPSGNDLAGDWDNGFANVRDGCYINKVDEGDTVSGTSPTPYYYSNMSYVHIDQTLFSPNRQIPSPVMFGSLPSGVVANRPWQTLLFRPDFSGLHPGNAGRTGAAGSLAGTPPDSLLLDLFHMPVVEPYAISEPLSTAGRINLNYQITPFNYLTRNSGIRAVLKSEKIIAIPDSVPAKSYWTTWSSVSAVSMRKDIDLDKTMEGFERRFDPVKYGLSQKPDLFRSPGEICQLPLVPVGATYAGMGTFWNTYRGTGDNSRERPYATIYPRLTTKSNTFTVHFRVQTLKKSPLTGSEIWDETKDRVESEYRGSQTVERYVDPSDPRIPDYADPAVYNSNDPRTNPSLDGFYRFRTLSTKRFAAR